MRRRLYGVALLMGCAGWSTGCGLKAVRAPEWIVGSPARYPAAQYLIGVGAAPTSGGLANALQAASASARAELAKTIEVRIDHLLQVVDESSLVEHRRRGRVRLALEAERSELSSFTRTSTAQLVQGIELKEKHHDEQRGILYVMAVLDRGKAGERLAREIGGLDRQARALAERGRALAGEGELLGAIRRFRQALNLMLKAEALQHQLAGIDPHLGRQLSLAQTSGGLAMELTELLLRYGFYVSVEGYPLIEDTICETMGGAGFDVRTRRADAAPGLTLWGGVNVNRGVFPALGGAGAEEMQVCRVYLGIKLVDDRSGSIVGQVNLLENSNAEHAALAEERALRLLRQRIVRELPAALYRALSFELE